DAPESEKHLFATMVFSTPFDRVKLLPEVRLATRVAEWQSNGYFLEAAVPLASIGLQPSDGLLLKADWGVLRTDAEGHAVLGRHYWSNPATAIVSDVAAEAELHPDLWGFVGFQLKVAEAIDKVG